jgi:hypothetical protein
LSRCRASQPWSAPHHIKEPNRLNITDLVDVGQRVKIMPPAGRGRARTSLLPHFGARYGCQPAWSDLAEATPNGQQVCVNFLLQ